MRPGSILQMCTQEPIPSPAERKLLWRTMGKQQFLLLQKPRGDGWGDGSDYSLELGQGRRVTRWWSLPVLTNDFPDVTDVLMPLLLICFTWHCAVATEEQAGLHTGFLAPLDCQREVTGSDLISEVLPVTQALASWGSAENGVSCLPFCSSLLQQEPEWWHVLRTCYAKILGQELWMRSRVRMYPLRLRWAKESPTLYFP